LNAASAGLRNLPNVSLDQPPRMADFAIWVNACEESLGMKPGEALTTYQSNRAETHHLALESSPLYEPVAQLAREGFRGTVAELHTRLNCMMSDSMRRSVRWPKAPNALSNALRRMASNLRAVGIEIRFSRADIQGRRVVSLVCASEPRKRSSVTVSSPAAPNIRKADFRAGFDKAFPRKIWETSCDSAMVVRGL